ncbi:hypothetical protein BUALT_Bualt05G0023800 [Buddleja alternifolia]|uniref:Sulfotransferase n=1 Tax=Buddleja alternifolia TaxID=168488 RepID=A0AAV6XG29_9LAMI|nr:hypothetical protein BUALT_Bualt05G0023800 [Buddleja alternifolia]
MERRYNTLESTIELGFEEELGTEAIHDSVTQPLGVTAAIEEPIEKTEVRKSVSCEVKDHKDESQELLQTLEQQTNWNGEQLVKYEGFWFPARLFRPILSTQKYFRAKDSDIILSTLPKSGTTWLKALTFSIVNRNIYTINQSPLLTSNPHAFVPFFELSVYFKQENPDLEHIPSPRIFSTHIPFNILPNSIRESECRVIYICRNPLDQFISLWHFFLDNKREEYIENIATDEAFDMFCKGFYHFGPFWDHMLGYSNAHLRDSQKVLFLKYEDLKEDITFNIKNIAEFIGFPFSSKEKLVTWM